MPERDYDDSQTQPNDVAAASFPYEQARAQVREWYRNELGREPSDAEVDSHLGGNWQDSGYMRNVWATISSSPESVEYRNRRGAEEAARQQAAATAAASAAAAAAAARDPYANYNGNSPPDVALNAGYGWEWDGSRWNQVAGRGLGFSGGQTHNVVKGPDGKPDPYLDYNGGSPPDAPLAAGKTWKWTGTRWEQVASGGGTGTTGSRVSGVPQSYSSYSSARTTGGGSGVGGGGGSSTIGGSVPTLEEAMAKSKQLFGSAPEILKPGTFTPPPQVGMEERNRIVQAILANPDVAGQDFQDALFEQQKEQQAQLAAQARSRLSQSMAARGLSAASGQELLGQAGIEEGFINSLLAARRDVTTKAAEANRASRLAAVEMADAVHQGDFQRAQAAYQTQLQANQIYNQLQLQAAELERGNVALVAQNLLAQREMQLGEQGQSFDQYMRQLQMNEMIRQFNEQLAFNYGKFGWEQQLGLAGLFPGSNF